MADAPRITVKELKRRMDAGEDFTVIDVRNPTVWAETDTVIPEAIRVPQAWLVPMEITTTTKCKLSLCASA
jgi:hypothetical protein